MRAKISVRVSKFFLTLLRNMRRRRKTSSIPSPFPFILLFGLIVLLRHLNVSSLSETIRNTAHRAVPNSRPVEEQPVKVDGEENVEKRGVSAEKRKIFMERRHAERRAIHRRIEEQKHEAHETGHTASKENSMQDVADRGSTMSDTASHSEGNESQVRNESHVGNESQVGSGSTKRQEQDSESSIEKTVAKDDMTSEHTSKRDETKSENSGMTEVDMNKSERRQESKRDEIPSGARVHGKQPEFGGSLGGSKDGMVRGQNVTRVSYTLFKIMRLFGFVSMVDSLAGSHVEWMGEVVERMSFDQPSFQYTAVDDEQGIEKARKIMGELVDGEYLVSNVEERTANGSDVVFHWTEVDGGESDARAKGYMDHIRKVMIAAKKGNNGYIVFGQFPRLDGPQPTYRKGKWVFMGEKEEPFLYNEHVRGVVPMGNGRESYMMYMTFYSLRSIPMEVLTA